MTIPEQVVAFLHGGMPGAFCDDCIMIGLNLPRRQEVAQVTLTLSICNGFQRMPGSCTSKEHNARQEKFVIRAL